jgi:hypothetical protein
MSLDGITTEPLSLKNRQTGLVTEVPAGAIVTWKDGNATITWTADGESQTRRISATTAARGLGLEAPSLEQLQEWVSDGIAESILGERVEPDGVDEHGSPSWISALGLI